MANKRPLTTMQFLEYLEQFEIAHKEYVKVINTKSNVLNIEERCLAIREITEKTVRYEDSKLNLKNFVMSAIQDSNCKN